MKFTKTLAVALSLATASVSFAADDAKNPAVGEKNPPAGVKATGVKSHPAVKSQRISKVIGMTVKNDAGKELGSINDVVVDMESGKIRYLAVSYGGWLGLGDKLFAVPLSAFKCSYNAENDEHLLVLNVPESKLKNAPGFDQDSWPTHSDESQWRAIDSYYTTGERVSAK